MDSLNTQQKLKKYFSKKKLFYSNGKQAVVGSSPITMANNWLIVDMTYNDGNMYVAKSVREASKPWGISIKTVSPIKKGAKVKMEVCYEVSVLW